MGPKGQLAVFVLTHASFLHGHATHECDGAAFFTRARKEFVETAATDGVAKHRSSLFAEVQSSKRGSGGGRVNS